MLPGMDESLADIPAGERAVDGSHFHEIWTSTYHVQHMNRLSHTDSGRMQDSLPSAVQGMAAARATRLYGDAVLNAAVCPGTLRARHSNASSIICMVSDDTMRHKSHNPSSDHPRKPVRPMRNLRCRRE